MAACDERLSWLTGFTGSAGMAAATRDLAAILVDGRYGLQVRAETDPAVFAYLTHPEESIGAWLAKSLGDGSRVGYDPWLHTDEDLTRLRERLSDCGAILVPVENLIDEIWHDRPPAPAEAIRPHPVLLAGRSSAEKRSEAAKRLTEEKLDATVLSQPDSIAWLLNVRGADTPRTPVSRSFALLHGDGRVDVFVEPGQATSELAAHVGNEVTLRPKTDLEAALDGLAGRVGVDRSRSPAWVADHLASNASVETVWSGDPCALPRACKTEAEIAGARAAHLRDGAAVTRFLHWLSNAGPSGELTEIDAVRRLEAFRQDTGLLRDISFETICGSGPNGAIVHYRVSEATNRRIAPGELLLIDSGGQYEDGTTDVTRTVAIGTAPRDAIHRFTLVLRGLAEMSRLNWPEGLEGRHIDAVARMALWRAGLDYDHGTGHGVGAYLSVHEGPQSLSRRSAQPLKPGMILSIEPGYYLEGSYGIRIENLAVVTPVPAEAGAGRERPMLGFETLTLAPIDRNLVDRDVLGADGVEWLDAYHARVFAELAPALEAPTRAWLEAACAPLARASHG